MNAKILNRNFEHPSDGWYQIEPKGRHPNRSAGVVQVIDEEAAASIVNRFNADADAGTLRHGHEMLIDHEHFSEQADKETVAYGWLARLQNRADGIYGQIRWTGTGKVAVDGGDYRFFSTVYEPADCKVLAAPTTEGRALNSDRGSKWVRPLRLDGLSLTNMNNNRGQKPITNRQDHGTTDHRTTDQFRRGLEAAAGSEVKNRGLKAPTTESKRMKSVATKLGLSADASEEAMLAEVTKVMNRATEAEGQVAPLTQRVTALETENTTLLSEQLDADFATAGIKDEKIVNRHKPLLSDPKHFKNRDERVAFIGDLVPKGTTGQRTTGQQTKLQNRDTKPPQGGKTTEEGDSRVDQAKAAKIMNRALELRKQAPTLSLATSVAMAQTEIENAS